MRLFYLIREYAKETEGASPEDFNDEILDLAFFDRIKR